MVFTTFTSAKFMRKANWIVESEGGFSGSPVLMLLFRPNYQPFYEPIGEFPAIESFG